MAAKDSTHKLSPALAAPYLDELRHLVSVARPGALFPPARAVLDWLDFLARPRPRLGPPTVEVHAASGFPVRRLLARLLSHQQAVRTFLAAHRAKATRASSSYHVALAATELPAVARTTARLVGRQGRAARLQVVHDAALPVGLLVRLTVHLTQSKGRAVTLDARDQATPHDSLTGALAACVGGDTADVFPVLEALPGLAVHEVERGALGPFLSARLPPGDQDAAAGALRPAVDAAHGAVLCLTLERVGESVRESRCLDPWGALPALTPAHHRRSLRAFRERRLVCTPPLEAHLKPLAPGCIVRSR